MRERRRQARLRQLTLQALQRRDEAHQPQLGRMQPVRQFVHAAGNILRPVHGVVGHRDRVALGRAAEQLEVDLQQRHLLADVIVQLARDPRPFGFLRVQQPRAKIADAFVAAAQLEFAAPHLFFGLTPPGPLDAAAPR